MQLPRIGPAARLQVEHQLSLAAGCTTLHADLAAGQHPALTWTHAGQRAHHTGVQPAEQLVTGLPAADGMPCLAWRAGRRRSDRARGSVHAWSRWERAAQRARARGRRLPRKLPVPAAALAASPDWTQAPTGPTAQPAHQRLRTAGLHNAATHALPSQGKASLGERQQKVQGACCERRSGAHCTAVGSAAQCHGSWSKADSSCCVQAAHVAQLLQVKGLGWAST